MTADKDALLPCPFCGNLPRIADLAGYEILCKCGIEMCLPNDPSKGGAIAAWNRRARITAALASESEAEAVAWRFKVDGLWFVGPSKEACLRKLMEASIPDGSVEIEPLYAAPVALADESGGKSEIQYEMTLLFNHGTKVIKGSIPGDILDAPLPPLPKGE